MVADRDPADRGHGGERSHGGHEGAAEQPEVHWAGDAVTTGSIPVITDDFVPPAPRPELDGNQVLGRLGVLLAAAVVAGAIAGLLWFAVTQPLPTYTINADGSAVTNEVGLSNYYNADAWFVVIGIVVGLGLGIASWRLLSLVGWPVVLLAVIGAAVAGLCCWGVGWLLGPGEFFGRIAEASPGDLVPISLNLRGPAALLAWMLSAVTPVLLWASLARDDEEPRPFRAPWRR